MVRVLCCVIIKVIGATTTTRVASLRHHELHELFLVENGSTTLGRRFNFDDLSLIYIFFIYYPFYLLIFKKQPRLLP